MDFHMYVYGSCHTGPQILLLAIMPLLLNFNEKLLDYIINRNFSLTLHL